MPDNNSKNTSMTRIGISGFLWNFSGSVVQILLQFIVIGILARLLTPEEFGIVAIIMIVVNFSDLFMNLGIGSALVQLPHINDKHVSLGYTLSVILGLFIGTAYYFSAPLVATFFDLQGADSAIQFFSIFFPLKSLNSVTNALLTRKLKFSVIVKCNVISYFLGLGLVSIVLALMGWGYWALILGQFAGLLITLAVLMYYERPSFSFKFHKQETKDLLFFGSGHTLSTVFNYFAENADNLIVGKLLGTVLLGIYSKAFQLLAIPAKFFGGIFDKVLFPLLSKKQDDLDKMKRFYLFSNSLCFALLVPISILIFINAEWIVDFVLGDQWDDVVLPLQILILGLAYRFGTKINKSYLKSMGLVYRGAYYQFIFASMMGVACYIGGKYYGLNGVAAGVFIATVLNYAQVSYRLQKVLRFSVSHYMSIHMKVLGTNLIFLIITLVLFYNGYQSNWLHLGLSLLVYTPIIALVFVSKRYVLFNEQNELMISQVLLSFPSNLKSHLGRIYFLKKYYEKG